MASVESVQPSTSNLMNPLIPTTVTAEILVENLPSSQSQANLSAAASLAPTLSYNPSSISSQSSSGSANNNNNSSSNNNNNGNEQEQSNETAESNVKQQKSDQKDEPEAKRRKIDHKPKIVEKLEARLGGILCCAVCLDLPRTAMYQCPMGHLMCAACFTHLLADGRLRDQVATCPNCRVEISKTNASRNLAVEKAVSELPATCQFCSNEYPSKSLEYHELNECDERPTDCKYVRIGCQWKGPNHEDDIVLGSKFWQALQTAFDEWRAKLEGAGLKISGA